MKVCLVGSSGGHLTHLYMLKPFWENKDRFWVTFDKEDARSLLDKEKMYPCYYPTNRSLKALLKNTKIAWEMVRYMKSFEHDQLMYEEGRLAEIENTERENSLYVKMVS